MAGMVHSLQTSLSPWGGWHQQLLTQSNWFNQSKHYTALCSAKPEHLPLSLTIPQSQLPLWGFSVQPSLGIFWTISLSALLLPPFFSVSPPHTHSFEPMCGWKAVLQRCSALYKDNSKRDVLIIHLREARLYHYLLIHIFSPPSFRTRIIYLPNQTVPPTQCRDTQRNPQKAPQCY